MQCQSYPDALFNRLVLKRQLFKFANVIKVKIHTKYKLIIHGYFILIKFLFKHSSFNQNVEKESGGGVINMTTIMVSQEIGDGAVKAALYQLTNCLKMHLLA